MESVRIAVEWIELEPMVRSICLNHARKYGGDFRDHFADSLLLTVRACKDYDDFHESGMALSSWVYSKVARGLLDIARTAARRLNKTGAPVSTDGLEQESSETRTSFIDLMDDIEAKGEDPLFVARLVIDPPLALRCCVPNTNARTSRERTRQAIMRYLVDEYDWTVIRAGVAFVELEECLTSVI